MSSTTANAAFTKVLDTDYDSKVLQGLLRILPETFQVIKGTATLGVTGVGSSVAVLDAAGNPILLTAGQQIVSASVAAITPVDSVADAAKVSIGTSNVPAGTGLSILNFPILVILSQDEVNGDAELPRTFIRLVQPDQKYLIAEVGTVPTSAGVVDVTLIVV